MSKHHWKILPDRMYSHGDRHYCETCGAIRTKVHTPGGLAVYYGPPEKHDTKEPRCIVVQRSLKLKFSALAFALILAACDCNYHYMKAQQKCGSLTRTDTITIRDTLRVPSVTTHTVFNYSQKDTVIVREGRLTIKYFRHDSVVYLGGKCDTVYVVREHKEPHTTTEIKFSWAQYAYQWRWVIVVFLIMLILVILIFREVWRLPVKK